MVRIVLAGGTGNVGREILDVLAEKGTHEITVFTRSDPSKCDLKGAKLAQVDYNDKAALTRLLSGVETVLSFIVAHQDPEGVSQKNLIDACISAGVKRFAPSEWGIGSGSGISFYASKELVASYLKEVNKDEKVLEYSLFQPGIFVNYLGTPHPSTKYVELMNFPIDLQNRRAIVPEADFPQSWTTVQDLTKVVVAAVEYPGVWPEKGGISGSKTTSFELLKIAASIRGPLKVEQVSTEAFDAGKLNTSWVPVANHPAIPPEIRQAVSETMLSELLRAGVRGAWRVGDEWNQALPDVQFTKVEEFLEMIWKDKP